MCRIYRSSRLPREKRPVCMPYVGDRLIDLSYAAAQQIGIAESGGGEIDMNVVKIGRGDREPPAAFNVTVPDTSAVAATPTQAPAPAPAPAVTNGSARPIGQSRHPLRRCAAGCSLSLRFVGGGGCV